MKTEVIELVERYYLDDDLDCSRQSPNKNDVMNVKINGIIKKKNQTFSNSEHQGNLRSNYETKSKSYYFKIQDLSIATKMGINSTFKQLLFMFYCANFDLIVTALKIVLKKSKSEFLTLK